MAKRDVGKAMTNAYREGVLSQGSMNALTALPDVGSEITAGLGRVADAAFLVTIMPDDSPSISTGAMQEAVMNGHNAVLEVATAQAGSCLVHTRYLNGTVLNPYGPAAKAKMMTRRNYRLTSGTPLYDQSILLLGTVFAKWREARPGSRPRTLTVLISDGGDNLSKSLPADVKALVSDMQFSGEHIIAAIGIDDGETDFRRVFGAMGIPRPWILTPEASAEAIAKAFGTIGRALAAGASDPSTFRQLTAGPPAD